MAKTWNRLGGFLICGIATAVADRGLGAQLQWLRKEVMPMSYRYAGAFDTRRARFVAVGKASNTDSALEVWDWDGRSWGKYETGGAPTGTFEHMFAFDAARGVFVLFTYTSASAQTWELSGRRWSLMQPRNSPALRAGAAMTYDPSRQRVLLFGGNSLGNPVNDTWEWDGIDWQQRSATSPPPPRTGARCAFDPARNRVLLFGGWNTGGTWYGDTWSWDGNQWTLLTPPTSPSGRAAHLLVADPGTRSIYLYGGRSGGPIYNDLWRWDGSTWTLLGSPAGPGPRETAFGAHDQARNRLVLCGGMTISARMPGDTWEWDGVSWSRHAGPQSPTSGGEFAYDILRQRAVLCGGKAWDGMRDTLATWEWDGVGWELRDDVTHSFVFDGYALAYDLARGQTVLFGGKAYLGTVLTWFNHTRLFDGTQWRGALPATLPAPREGAAMAYDAIRQRTVMFGGVSSSAGHFGDTWEWDGSAWALRATGGPPPRAWHAMTYDLARQRVLLHGGSTYTSEFGDSWEWNGTAWQRLSITGGPGIRISPSMAYDVRRQRVVLHGGYDRTTVLTDTWEWDGTQWMRLPITVPRAFVSTRIVYDLARARTLLVQGDVATYVLSDGVSAAAAGYGSGCGSTSTVPVAQGFGSPFLGNRNFRLELFGALPNVPCAAVAASGSAQIPLPGGCTLWIDPLSAFSLPPGTTGSIGQWSVPLPVLLDPSVMGQVAYVQFASLDGGVPILGLGLTGGLRLTWGD
jgi:hypothetical protein